MELKLGVSLKRGMLFSPERGTSRTMFLSPQFYCPATSGDDATLCQNKSQLGLVVEQNSLTGECALIALDGLEGRQARVDVRSKVR